MGKEINKATQEITHALIKRQHVLYYWLINNQLFSENIDITLPGRNIVSGNFHPISNSIKDMEYFFNHLGFTTISGPEIEDEYHNFDALNISNNHPSRTNNDSFWVNSNNLLRTQTSSVQIRILEKKLPPMRIIAPGKVYRKDHSRTHSPMFHQLEGLIVDENINFSNLKEMLVNFLQYFFSEKIKIRFRPSYFPFTVPSAEIDIMDNSNNWLEVLGCGLVHPNVLKNSGINPDKYTGIAFGIGIERLTMLKYNVDDVRLFFENNLGYLHQFR